MEYRYAKKLENGDQITLKQTKECTQVHTVIVEKKRVLITAFTSNGWIQLTHWEIE